MHDVCADITFFGPDPRKYVTMTLSQKDWGCILGEKKEMDGSILDFTLHHLLYRAEPEVRSMYHLSHNWIANTTQMMMDDKANDWEIVIDAVYRSLQSGSGSATHTTLILPFHDRSHWSIFIVEEDVTYHIDTLNYHRDDRARNFIYLMHMGWALVKGVNPGTPEWTKWQQRGDRKIRCFQQGEAWECGMMACLSFWQYMLLRGKTPAITDEVLRRQEKNWQQWSGQKARLWVVQALYTELVRPHPEFDPPDIYNYKPLQALSIREKNEEDDLQILTPNSGRRATSVKVRVNRGIAATIPFDIRTFRIRAPDAESKRANPLSPVGSDSEVEYPTQTRTSKRVTRQTKTKKKLAL